MREPTVAAVMSHPVCTASRETPFREIIAGLLEGGVLPVIDDSGAPVGMVSAKDALAKLEFRGGAEIPGPFAGRALRARWRKARGVTAGELMTSPVASIGLSTGVRVAARQLTTSGLHRLCVVDEAGGLAGLVSRRDLLMVFLRPDSVLEEDIRAELRRRVHSGEAIRVRVCGRIARLAGAIRFHSSVDQAESIARSVPGVIDVCNRLSYDFDDYQYV
ncbi:CBS domain-containing protein [Amycolatopsis pigmentata]|uniref:CBS domain-containing protein n=1 Tax=Amycolatopsis pigmentata TaxID=450801 RepID=A0ABW5G5H5_9PSEU